jgi:hypothetical protein
MFVPKIYLSCPEYCAAHEHSVLARYAAVHPDAPPGERVELACDPRAFGSSLLPKTFNSLFCSAMDARDRGEATHFAMLHDDIWPDNWFLNTLWREMQASGADLVSVVMPIKDAPWWRTSTAIGLVDDPWIVPRYIRAEDRQRLPTTFTADDVCKPGELLLVNTGCWLADLRKPWWDEFCEAGAFGFETRVTRAEDGTRLSWIQPEDWRMSRFLGLRGAKLAATYAVRARHRGGCWWSNYDDPISMQAVNQPAQAETPARAG